MSEEQKVFQKKISLRANIEYPITVHFVAEGTFREQCITVIKFSRAACT